VRTKSASAEHFAFADADCGSRFNRRSSVSDAGRNNDREWIGHCDTNTNCNTARVAARV
jgi:hypothetical protein